MKFFYARCSTRQQNEARQIEDAKNLGIEPENIFIDKRSGKNTDRPALHNLFSRLRKGDELYITELSRLGRSTKDLLNLVDELNQKGVALISKKEAIDTTTPTGRLTFHVFAAIAEFQREIINEAAAEGRAVSNKKPGRPKVNQDKLEYALSMFANNPDISVAKISELSGVSRATIYNEANNKGIARAI